MTQQTQSLIAQSKTYNNYGTYLRNRYEGKKVFKIIVDAGFTCPNRDGSKGFGGCTYCNVDSFTPALTRQNNTIEQQVVANIQRAKERYEAQKFIIYFQPNTNTYADIETLKRLYDRALNVEKNDVVGLSVGTRADCLDTQKLDLFDQYAQNLDVDLEIGMESMYDQTLKAINRQSTHQAFLDTIEQCRNRHFDVCVHTIFGLPNETQEMWLNVAHELNRLPIKFVKLHHLYIAKGSIMGVKYLRNPEMFNLFSLESYTDFLCQFIPLLRPDMVIQRLFAVSDYEFHIAPSWGLQKNQIQSHIDRTLANRNIKQGSLYQV